MLAVTSVASAQRQPLLGLGIRILSSASLGMLAGVYKCDCWAGFSQPGGTVSMGLFEVCMEVVGQTSCADFTPDGSDAGNALKTAQTAAGAAIAFAVLLIVVGLFRWLHLRVLPSVKAWLLDLAVIIASALLMVSAAASAGGYSRFISLNNEAASAVGAPTYSTQVGFALEAVVAALAAVNMLLSVILLLQDRRAASDSSKTGAPASAVYSQLGAPLV